MEPRITIEVQLRWDPEQPHECGEWIEKALEILRSHGGDFSTLQIRGTGARVGMTARIPSDKFVQALDTPLTPGTIVMITIEDDPCA